MSKYLELVEISDGVIVLRRSDSKESPLVKIEFSKPSLKYMTLTGIIVAKDIHQVLETVSLLTQHKFKLIGDIYTFI